MTRIGIIGCGRVTRDHHLPAIASLRDVHVVALADPESDRVEDTAEQFGISRTYSTAGDLLGSEDVDLVCIATPPATHVQLALEALERRVPVLVEKPLALDIREGTQLVDAFANAGVLAGCAFNLRCHPLVADAEAIIRQGQLGAVRAVRSVFAAPLRLADGLSAWRRAPESGGGALSELAVHHVDLLSYLFGDRATHIVATVRDDPVREDSVAIVLEFPGGIVATGLFCQGTAPAHELEIFGDSGRLRLSLYQTDGLRFSAWNEPVGGVLTRLRAIRTKGRNMWLGRNQLNAGGPYAESFRRQWAAVVNAVRNKTPLPASLADGHYAQGVIEAARKSATRHMRERIT
jgi:predicted dehydrogenase